MSADDATLFVPPPIVNAFPANGDEAAKTKALTLRLMLAPPRVAWANRFLGNLPTITKHVVNKTLADEYAAAEKELIEFETAMIGYRLKANDPAASSTQKIVAAEAAAFAAGKLRLYGDLRDFKADSTLNISPSNCAEAIAADVEKRVDSDTWKSAVGEHFKGVVSQAKLKRSLVTLYPESRRPL